MKAGTAVRSIAAFAVTFSAVFILVGATSCAPTATCRHHARAHAVMNLNYFPYLDSTAGEVSNDSTWTTTGYGTSTSPASGDCYGLDARSIATTKDAFCRAQTWGVWQTTRGDCYADRLNNGPVDVKNDVWSRFAWKDNLSSGTVGEGTAGAYTLHGYVQDNRDAATSAMTCAYYAVQGGSAYEGHRDYNCTGETYR